MVSELAQPSNKSKTVNFMLAVSISKDKKYYLECKTICYAPTEYVQRLDPGDRER